jgi:hypothetical protein
LLTHYFRLSDLSRNHEGDERQDHEAWQFEPTTDGPAASKEMKVFFQSSTNTFTFTGCARQVLQIGHGHRWSAWGGQAAADPAVGCLVVEKASRRPWGSRDAGARPPPG